jgi:hypothetical protein
MWVRRAASNKRVGVSDSVGAPSMVLMTTVMGAVMGAFFHDRAALGLRRPSNQHGGCRGFDL